MTARARAVPARSRGEFLRVTSFAGRGLCAAVRLVTTRAGLVPWPRVAALGGMTIFAQQATDARIVRQPAVTAFTRGVPGARRDQGQLLLMAILTQGMLCELDREVMRRMAVLACHLAVKGAIGRRELMTAAARSRDGVSALEPGVRIVAGQTTAGGGAFGVIGMNGTVAVGAGYGGVLAHVMGHVAADAARVLRHLGLGQHHHVRVTGATLDHLFGFERVRPMTAHALRVTARKERRGRDDRLIFAMTLDAGRDRVRRRRVLMRVTGRAYTVRSFVERGVRGVSILVAATARRSHGFLVLVRLVAIQARRRRVDRHGRDATLRLAVAARAIAGAVGQERAAAGPFPGLVWRGEGMTAHAVRARGRTQTRLRGPGGVLEARLGLVARGAARGRHGSNAGGADLVTAIARDVLLLHVQAVPNHAPVGAPLLWNVNAAPGGSSFAALLRRGS